MEVFLEAIFMGLLVLIVGTIVSGMVGKSFSVDLPPVCRDWNKNYIMEICLFLTGFFAHLLCEFFGVNRWYCKKGYACSRR